MENFKIFFVDDAKCKAQSLEAHIEATIAGSDGQGSVQLTAYGVTEEEAFENFKTMAFAAIAELHKAIEEVEIDPQRVKDQQEKYDQNQRFRYY